MSPATKPRLRLHLDGQVTPADPNPRAAALYGPAIVDRLQIAYGVHSVSALAKVMRRPLGGVMNWSRRGTLRLQHVAQASRETNRSIDWLVFGIEPGAH